MRLQDRYKDKGLVILGVNAWNEDAARVEAFAKAAKANFPILLRGADVAAEYGVEGVPTTVFIDAEGRIAGSRVGFPGEAGMADLIDELLKAKS